MKSQQSRLSLTDEDMAALILLLVAFFSNNILAEVLKMEGVSHHFILNRTADDVCLISRWIGEEKELLWNSSQDQDFSLETKDYDYNLQTGASYTINTLKVSDSGQYQEQCWTQNNVTHERNFTLLVCDTRNMRLQSFYPYVGQTLELNCDGAGPNQSVQWALGQSNHRTINFELALIDDETSSIHKLQQVKNKTSLLVTFDRSSGLFFYYCLEKNHQSCELLEEFYVSIQDNYIHRWVGESLELNCSDFSGNEQHVWKIYSETEERESLNYTLMFPSLTLDHTGRYTCERGDQFIHYFLYMCPESDPPADVFFTGGENVTLRCDWKQPDEIRWFMKTNRTEGRTSRVYQGQVDRIFRSDTSLVITNISLEHSGEFWCVIMKDDHCVFTSKTLVMFGEPEVDHHLVRSVMLSVVIFMMCVVVVVVVVVVVQRSRSREQLPAPVEEVEMLEVSPADVQPETL